MQTDANITRKLTLSALYLAKETVLNVCFYGTMENVEKLIRKQLYRNYWVPPSLDGYTT